MKKIVVLLSVVFLLSCKKENSSAEAKPEDIQKANSFEAQWQNQKFRITRYYSPVPIDYNDTDAVVDAKTDLWEFVSNWIKDDTYSFANGKATITQNAIKIPNDSRDQIPRDIKVGADADGAYFLFVGHEYQGLKYLIDSFTDSSLNVHAKWHDKDVYTEYKKVTP